MFTNPNGSVTFGNDTVQLTATPRLAGAVEFLTFKGKQFLDNLDHGREMQTAYWNNGKGGCENPTQAGNGDDGTNQTTSTSVMRSQSSTWNSYTSTVWPAYWFSMGEACDGSGGNTVVSNVASDQPLTTVVTVGVDGDDQVIHYVSTIENQYSHSSMVVSSGLAMTGDFSHALILKNGTFQDLDFGGNDMVWQPYAPIVATPDGNYAVGLVAANQNGVTASFSVSENGVAGINLVMSYGALPAGTLTQEEYIIVGTLADVEARMPALQKKVRAAAAAATATASTASSSTATATSTAVAATNTTAVATSTTSAASLASSPSSALTNFHIVTFAGKCLDLTGVSAANGTLVQQYNCNGGAQQTWNAVASGSGYQLVSNLSGRCLDIINADASNGTQIQEWDCNGSAQQQWQLSVTGAATQIISVLDGKCLDVTGVSSSNGVKLQQYDCLGSGNQSFTLAQ